VPTHEPLRSSGAAGATIGLAGETAADGSWAAWLDVEAISNSASTPNLRTMPAIDSKLNAVQICGNAWGNGPKNKPH
jgi:hypothetical protein